MKTKATPAGKSGSNFPAGGLNVGATTVGRPAPNNPDVYPANTWNPGYPTSGTTPRMPAPTDSMLNVILNPTEGFSDTGVSHTGDLGGAG